MQPPNTRLAPYSASFTILTRLIVIKKHGRRANTDTRQKSGQPNRRLPCPGFSLLSLLALRPALTVNPCQLAPLSVILRLIDRDRNVLEHTHPTMRSFL